MIVETIEMYLSVVGDRCSIMSNDYELTMDYDMIVVLLNVDFKLINMIVLIFGTYGLHV